MTVNPLQTTTSAVRFSVKLKDATMNTKQMSNDYVGANARSLEGGATSPRSSEPAAEAGDSFVGPDEGKVCRGAWMHGTLGHVCRSPLSAMFASPWTFAAAQVRDVSRRVEAESPSLRYKVVLVGGQALHASGIVLSQYNSLAPRNDSLITSSHRQTTSNY
jgi:hypothetical protein